MRISVIITVHNLERYVADAIRSATEQTRCPDEVVVVDDASSDGSRAVVATFGDRVTVVELAENKGVLQATLAGLAVASGDIVCFLDGDDIWEPEKLEQVEELLNSEQDVVFVSHDYTYCSASGGPLPWHDQSQRLLRRERTDDRATDRTMRRSILRYEGLVWLGSAFCLRRDASDFSAFTEWCSRLRHPEWVYQDHPLATFVALTSRGRFAYIDQPLLRYRVHSDNASGAATQLMSAEKISLKGWATHAATLTMIEQLAPGRADLIARQRQLVAENAFRLALYRGQYRNAWHELEAAWAGWSLAEKAKELARFSVIAGSGRRAFFALKSMLRLARNRPH